MPLLPFEKQLIDTIGCTEDEYTRLVFEAIRRSGTRPVGYDNIPEIYAILPVLATFGFTAAAGGAKTAALISAAISLAVGLALSAISYLLTPKPKNSGASNSSQRTLESITGANRFTPTSGFDTQAELADYAEPIPIIFGAWTGTTGGMLVTPKLVWSRMFSYGTQQGVKLLFVIGEQGQDAGQTPQGLNPPKLQGIFLGNGALDSVYENLFAFYWKRNTTISGVSRVKSFNLTYGTRGGLATGDPEVFHDIFSCPTAVSENDYGFSSVQSLSNGSEFGCFAPIPNGTVYRVNWSLVSLLRQKYNFNSLFERIKVAGDYGETAKGGDYPERIRDRGMEGTGRNYSRRMGLTHLNGAGVSDSVGIEQRYVNVGDIATFTISAQQLPINIYTNYESNVRVDDINSALNEQRIAADDALQIGELFMIARTTWQVISRSRTLWRPEDKADQLVQLKCIDINAPAVNRVGFVSPYMLNADVLWDGNNDSNSPYTAGAAFFPLMRVSFGTVRNTRPCEVTEFGLRSRVYQRFNGLANFQSLPTPRELKSFDDDNIQVTSGVINSYGKRASAFTIFLRPAGLDTSGQPYTWQPLGETFVVVGNQPVDQYNFIRVQHPQPIQYEFRFIPQNGASLGNFTADTDQFWQLSASSSSDVSNASQLSNTYNTAYGLFKVTAAGKQVIKTDIKRNLEFTSRPSQTATVIVNNYPSAVGIFTILPDEEDSATTVSSTEFVDWYTEPTYNYTEGRNGAWTWELFGAADANPIAEGATIERTIRHETLGLWYNVSYVMKKYKLPDNHYSGQIFSWGYEYENIVGSSSGWNSSASYIITRDVSNSNPFRTPTLSPSFTKIGQRRRVTGVVTRSTPIGRAQGWYEQLFGPARNYSTGTTRTADIVVPGSNSIRRIKLTLTASVIDKYHDQANVYKLWTAPTVVASQDPAYSSTKWKIGDRFQDLRTVSNTNPFRKSGTLIGAEFIIQGISQVLERDEVFDAGRIFEQQSQYADLSLYGNSVEKSNFSSPEHAILYVNEMVSNEKAPEYDKMTIAGLALKASRNFTSLDQLRVWLKDGVPVKRFHPDDQGVPVAPSNLFCDLVFYLLTSPTAGVGKQLGMDAEHASLINTADLVTTAKFLRANKLFFDGAISSAVNLRQFISGTAPYMLCNFVIADGQFSLQPAVPTDSTGSILTTPVKIKQLFTGGNILENSYQLEYLPAEERKAFQASVRFRAERENQLPEEKNIVVRWNNPTIGGADSPLEQFDLTQYCTSRDHAELVARFFLSIRRRVTHTIKFATTPLGISLAPGDYIRVFTESSPYSSAKNGTINNAGVITSATTFADGQYNVLYYRASQDDVEEGPMTVSGGKVQETVLFNTLFTVIDTTVSQNVYMVEQLTLTEDSTVEITATEFPCDASGSSLIAQDLLAAGQFIIDN